MLDIRSRTGYLFLAVVLGHVILISAQVNSRSGGKVLERVALGAFGEVQRGADAVIGGVARLWRGYVALRGVAQENEALRRELAAMQVRLQQERALAARAARFEALLDLKARLELPTLAAQVIGGEANPGFATVTIDKGERDGVRADMAVIAPAGVVGRIYGRPAAHTARVQLIIGLNAGAGAMIERSRAGGVVVGGWQDPPLVMDYVAALADVRPGDLVVTAGTDGIYPKGLPLGRVERIERASALHKVVRVRPAVDFSNIEEVLVITAPPPGRAAAAPEGRS
ncbi:MAG TPA: rod shape-determining protein MreC [Vicinamibacterales bacterium]|nr:rod shape-determining protein MreC [Vicinamibacterales bacterium]